MEAVNTRDLDKAVLVYTEDCSMMSPGLDVARGHEGGVHIIHLRLYLPALNVFLALALYYVSH